MTLPSAQGMLLHLLTAGFGTFRTCRPRQPMSGFRGEAAVPQKSRDGRV
jgi:hypothetical protein